MTPSTRFANISGDRWNALVLPVLREIGAQEIMRKTGREKSAVYEVLSGKPMKYGGPAKRYQEAALEAVISLLRDENCTVPRHPAGALYLAVCSEMKGGFSAGLRRGEAESKMPRRLRD